MQQSQENRYGRVLPGKFGPFLNKYFFKRMEIVHYYIIYMVVRKSSTLKNSKYLFLILKISSKLQSQLVAFGYSTRIAVSTCRLWLLVQNCHLNLSPSAPRLELPSQLVAFDSSSRIAVSTCRLRLLVQNCCLNLSPSAPRLELQSQLVAFSSWSRIAVSTCRLRLLVRNCRLNLSPSAPRPKLQSQLVAFGSSSEIAVSTCCLVLIQCLKSYYQSY